MEDPPTVEVPFRGGVSTSMELNYRRRNQGHYSYNARALLGRNYSPWSIYKMVEYLNSFIL
jgi:hypothetical protein